MLLGVPPLSPLFVRLPRLVQVQHILGHELHQEQQAEGGQQQYDVSDPPGPFMPASKVCSKCKAVKPTEQFFRDKSKADGLYSQVSCPMSA